MELTKRQKDILEVLVEYRRRHSISPTMDEIALALRLNKKTIYEHLQRLRSRGVITWRRYEARSIKVLKSPFSLLPFFGYIAAGRPIEALPLGDEIDISEILSCDRESFVLQVRGDSMIDEHIRDGDFVLMERRDHAENGETVVALLDNGEATLKMFYREKGRIRLQPANPAMKPIYTKNVSVQGVVIGIIRKYRRGT